MTEDGAPTEPGEPADEARCSADGHAERHPSSTARPQAATHGPSGSAETSLRHSSHSCRLLSRRKHEMHRTRVAPRWRTHILMSPSLPVTRRRQVPQRQASWATSTVMAAPRADDHQGSVAAARVPPSPLGERPKVRVTGAARASVRGVQILTQGDARCWPVLLLDAHGAPRVLSASDRVLILERHEVAQRARRAGGVNGPLSPQPGARGRGSARIRRRAVACIGPGIRCHRTRRAPCCHGQWHGHGPLPRRRCHSVCPRRGARARTRSSPGRP